MQDSRSDCGTSRQRRNPLPPLAPRDSRSSSTRERSVPSSRRPPRLSHRSRAGCWTCRGRKVKCDEERPRCGPCTRLNRDCDWDHRWNFSDATQNTQVKYTNVDTKGNVVWDPEAQHEGSNSHQSGDRDDLPEFAALMTDEDRERKAGVHRPGTYGVVVTPESFHDLPEYASVSTSPTAASSRRTSAHSSRGGYGSPMPFFAHGGSKTHDPTTVILDRFEDVSLLPFMSAPTTDTRQVSFPESLQRLSITTSAFPEMTIAAPPTSAVSSSEGLAKHFREYVVPRLVQPQVDSMPEIISQGSTKDVLEQEAARFPPLHHAICAISALNLSYNGRSSLEAALQNYHQALAASATAASTDDLISDGVFFRHFLLFVYDICVPMDSDDGGADMWAEHLSHLQRIAVHRHRSNGREPYAYTLWTICNLDMYACLMGSGSCDFVKTIAEHDMLPSLDQQVPSLSTAQTSESTGPFLQHEVQIFPAILRLNEGIILRAAKFAQTASIFRSEHAAGHSVSPGRYARWQAATTQLQTDLHSFWQQAVPTYLASESPEAISALPERPRCIFENALLLYHATTIYSRTSMFHGQRRIPVVGQSEIALDTEHRVRTILAMAGTQIEHGHLERRHIVFPIFIAGYATSEPEAKFRAMDLIGAFEGSGIGQNTHRTRQLLMAVCEEQRRVKSAGGRMEDVEWLAISRERGLNVVNCGL